MSIAYLPGAAAAGLLQGGGRLSLVFVLSSLLYGVFLTSQIILSFRMREKAANVSRNVSIEYYRFELTMEKDFILVVAKKGKIYLRQKKNKKSL